MTGGGALLQGPAGQAYQAAKLRWATLADSARLHGLFSEARPDEPEAAEVMTDWLEHGGALLLEDDSGELLSAVRWRENGEGWRLDRVCTHPQARGQGFGRWLMTKVEALAIRYNVPTLSLQLADAETNGYYRRLGYDLEDDSVEGAVVARKRVGGVWQLRERSRQ